MSDDDCGDAVGAVDDGNYVGGAGCAVPVVDDADTYAAVVEIDEAEVEVETEIVALTEVVAAVVVLVPVATAVVVGNIGGDVDLSPDGPHLEAVLNPCRYSSGC